MFRIGIAGCGAIGAIHAIALQKELKAELCAFADINIERAEKFNSLYAGGKAAAYSSLDEMLNHHQLDVIHICTPHYLHVPMAVQILKQGLHVFMEKPPAISRVQFQELKDTAAQSIGKVGVCFQNRYNETTGKINSLLEEKPFGKILGARGFVTWYRTKQYYTESGWRGALATEGGGVLINQSVHTLDLMLLWLGKPLSVDAVMCNHHLKGIIEVEDTLEAYMTFTEKEEPVRAVFYATNAYTADLPVVIELTCEHGFVRLDGDYVWYQSKENPEPVLWKAPFQNTEGKSYWGAGHEACIHDYYESLAAGRPYRNDLGSVEIIFDTMMRIYESARGKEKRK